MRAGRVQFREPVNLASTSGTLHIEPGHETAMDADARHVGQIKEILRRIEAAENNGTPCDIVAMLAEDAVIMVPNEPVQEGKAACSSFVSNVLTDLFERFDRHIVYVSAEVRALGEYGFDRGTFSFTVRPRSGGETSRETGKYLFLYLRAADGSWRIARAIVNLDDHERNQSA
jgi:ketosteroid isomerase-like protein